MTDLTADQEKDEKFTLNEISASKSNDRLVKTLEKYFNDRYSSEIGPTNIKFDKNNKEFVVSNNNQQEKTEYPESIPLLIRKFREQED